MDGLGGNFARKEMIVDMKKLVTTHVKPPIPARGWDWSATFDTYEPGDVVGWGRTKEEAERDLLHNVRCGKTCNCVTNCGDDGGD